VNGHARAAIEVVPGVRDVAVDGATVRARVGTGAATLTGVLASLDAAKIGLASVTVARPSLDDVYLRHAGRSFQAADDAGTKEVAA
jgi:ABC-2 type transport system ATP-binding protein